MSSIADPFIFISSMTLRGIASPPPAVIMRRAFKKSRRGCRTCKARKVKCDEVHPICGNCARRFIGLESCDFDPFIDSTAESFNSNSARDRTQHFELPLASLCPSLIQYPSEMSNSSESRVLELRLMHHYTTSTCAQLPDGHSLQGKHVWAIDIPQLAFHSDLVLSALLGISALHLWALSPNDEQVAHAGRHHFDRAVRNHRLALSNADTHSAESLLATAILITHHTWLAAHCPAPGQPYELPLQTYYMARGIQALIEQMWPLLKGSGYLWYVEQQPIEEVGDEGCENPFLVCVRKDLAELEMTFDNEAVPVGDKEVYQSTVTELMSMCKSICTAAPANWIQRRVATMPIRLPARFLEMVEEKDPRALALLARNLALLKVIDSIWWLHGAGESQKVAEYAIVGITGLMPPEWIWATAWPRQVVAGDITPG